MSNVDDCGLTESINDFADALYFVIYYVIMPVYFISGMSGNVLLLLAFRKQSRTDKAYAYQIFLTVSKTFEIFCGSVFWWGYKWNAGVERPGHLWYMNNYVLMFFAAHVGCPLANGFIITSLLFSVAMTADRVFALSKPFVYKNIKTRKHQAVAAILCTIIGLSTSIFEVNRWHILPGTPDTNATYSVQYDEDYLSIPIVMALGHMRTAMRLVSLTTLIVLNVVMAVVFRKRTKKVGKISAGNDKKEQERKVAEKTLLALTIYQSLLMLFAHIPHSIYFIAAFISPKFDRCYGIVVAPFADGCICVADAADLFVIIGINKKMRRTVFRVLPCCKMPPEGATNIGVTNITVHSRAPPSQY